MPIDTTGTQITGRCYCGAISFRATAWPTAVAYCHCIDCRRVTGAPVAAFAAFPEGAVVFLPNEGRSIEANSGALRSFCANCGSSLTGRYAYLPGQVYVPLGIIDQADALPPQIHAHGSQCLSWLRIEDGLTRASDSARKTLVGASCDQSPG
ncbi:MAG: GFA family protein [Pseudomonadota bacterium]